MQNNVTQNQEISNRVEQVVGPEGAVIENGGIRVDIPAGALNEDVTIAVTEYDPMDQPKAAPEGFVFVSNVYELEPHAQGFGLDVNLQIDLLPDTQGFAVGRATETGEFEFVPPDLIDDQMAVISTPVFSYYAVFGMDSGGMPTLQCDPRDGVAPDCGGSDQCVAQEIGDELYELQCQSSTGDVMAGEECSVPADCGAGLTCVDGTLLSATCVAASCCTPFCTNPSGNECEMTQQCDRFDTNTPTEAQDLGICID